MIKIKRRVAGIMAAVLMAGSFSTEVVYVSEIKE